MMHARRTAGESGVTLLELLVVVVLIAIIIVPISNALFEGITLPSVDANRSAAAAARSLMSLQFDDDVAAAQTVMVGDGKGGPTDAITCPSASQGPNPLVTLNWSDNTTSPPTPIGVVYQLTYVRFNASLTTVQITRTETKATSSSAPQNMLTGYCAPGSSPLVTASVTPNCASSCSGSYGAYEQRVQLKVTMYDGPNDGLNSFSFEAAQRDTCASHPTPGVACGVMSTLLRTGTTTARLTPYMLAVDGSGDIYIADAANSAIREVAGKTGMQWGRRMTAGNIYTVAGHGGTYCGQLGSGSSWPCGDGGYAKDAYLNIPYAVTVAPDGSLYFGDTGDNVVRMIPKHDMPNGTWGISNPDPTKTGLEANHIYTIAGSRPPGLPPTNCPIGLSASSTALNQPKRVVFDKNGNLFFSDAGNNCIREVKPGGTISNVATGLGHPMGLAVDSSDNIYIADRDNNRILEAVPASIATENQWGMTMNGGSVYTVVGNSLAKCAAPPSVGCPPDPAATNANLLGADDVAVDADGNLFTSDVSHNAIREIASTTHTQWPKTQSPMAMTAGNIYTIAGTYSGGGPLGGTSYTGDGYPATVTNVAQPRGVALDSAGDVFFTDTSQSIVRELSAASDRVFTVAGYHGNGSGYAGDDVPAATPEVFDVDHLATDSAGNVFIADTTDSRIREWNAATGEVWTIAGTGSAGFSGNGGLAVAAQVNNPTAAVADSNDNVYVVDAGNNLVRKIDALTKTISSISLNPSASFNFGAGGGDIAVDSAGNVYVADTGNCVVREFDSSGNHAKVVAGSTCGMSGDGIAATSAKLNGPSGIDVAANGDVYIADTLSNRVRYVTSDGTIHAFAGTGTACSGSSCGDGGASTSAQLNAPNDVAVTSWGVYIADTGDAAIRKVPVGGGAIITVAGTLSNSGTSGDGGSATQAQIAYPYGLAFDANGTLYISNLAPTSPGGPIRQVFSPE